MKKLLKEQKISPRERSQLMREFIKFCAKELNLQKPTNCKIKFTMDKNETETYAHFDPSDNKIVVYIKERGMADSGRSLCHELKHLRQRQQNQLKPNSGETGSDEENLANAVAGIIMRKFGKIRPEIYRFSS